MNSLRALLARICMFLLGLMMLSCAGQIPPTGGPADSVPPEIIRTEPDTNAVRVKADRIVLEFSEYVDRRSVEESIFISPYVGQLEFDWSGTEVTITFTEQLKRNTSYVVNVGTDVKDIRAGNRMAHGFTLAFSTGDSIDTGVIIGKVFDDKPEGIMVFAYALSGIKPDTLDPARIKPDYIMQTGKDGTFTLSNIRFDTYRVFAVRDQYRNLVYDKQIDEIGMTTGDIRLNETRPRIDNVWFRLFVEDTTKPFLTRVVPISRRQLQLRFNEPLDTTSFPRARIVVKDTVSNAQVGILLQSLDNSDSTAAVVLLSASVDSGRMYRLSVAGVTDRSGNEIDAAAATFDFAGVGTQDTVKPTLTFVGMRDSIKEIPLAPVFRVHFSEPVDTLAAVRGFRLLDSLKNALPLVLRWSTALDMVVVPQQPLLSKAWYALRVQMDSVRDYWRNGYKDSVLVIHFQSLDLKTTGMIEGTITDEQEGENLGDVVVTVTRVQSQSPVVKTLRLQRPGQFSIAQLPEGFYTLHAYRDRDSSGSYSFGTLLPFHPAERFVVYPDTLKVRARWAAEGVAMKFPVAVDSAAFPRQFVTDKPTPARDATIEMPKDTIRVPQVEEPHRTPTPSRGAGYTVQIGSFSHRHYADEAEALARQRFEVPVVKEFDPERGLYRVQVGLFETWAEAAEFRTRMMNRYPGEYKNGWIVRLRTK